MKLISIGMPVYNCSDFIEDAIKSIIRQTYTNWELILIDDNSSDNTLDKIIKYNDPRIRIIKNEINKGLTANLNECIRLGNGAYFARMDGDDIMVIDRLERQIKFLEENKDIDVIGSLAYSIDKDKKILGYVKTVFPHNLKDLIRYESCFIHPTVMGKMDWFRKNLYDEDLKRSQDFELWIRTYESSKFHLLNEYLLFYRVIADDYKQKYYQAYVNLKKIFGKHRYLISTLQYYKSISLAYIKYLFYDIFYLIGFRRSNALSPNSIDEIQKKLSEATN